VIFFIKIGKIMAKEKFSRPQGASSFENSP
jgi:hypothetical protein